MNNTVVVQTWKEQYLSALQKLGIEKLAARAANVSISKVLYFRKIHDDFREAEIQAKEEYKKKAKRPITW